MKQGQGKEYHENVKHLKYEGLFVDDQYNDFNAKLYYKNGKLEYEGMFKNGLKHGKGVEYSRTGKILYTGGYVKGVRHCQYTKLFYPSGKVEYEGEIFEGMREGKGKEYNTEGDLVYEGDFYGDVPNGKGTFYYKTYPDVKEYEGAVKNG